MECTFTDGLCRSVAATIIRQENRHGKAVPGLFPSRQQTRGEYAGLEAADRLPSDPWFDGDQVQTALHQAIAKLPPKQKAVFLLRYFEEMPYEKIAQVLETSEGALKASYHHAYEKVKAWMKESLEAKY